MKMEKQFLLLEDVGKLGRKGDIVVAKPGFARNYLLPQKKAVIATKQTLRMRARLQEERAKQAAVDKKEAESLAKTIENKVLKTVVKVDPAGNLYGSVSAVDIVKLFEKEGVVLEKHHVILPIPLKKVGKHRVDLKLNEGVPAFIFVEIAPEGGVVKKAAPAEKKTEEAEEAPEGESTQEEEK